MASIGYDLSTIQDILTIIDENKQNINEQTYVKICNCLKSIHTRVETINALCEPIRVPYPEFVSPEKIRLDYRYRNYVHTRGQISDNSDKLLVLNSLTNKNNLHYTYDYQHSVLRYCDFEDLKILYIQQRKIRCQRDPVYIALLNEYKNMFNEDIKLCFCD